MHVVICSLVKNGMLYLPTYRKQLEGLVLPPEVTWSLCILEGDSVDGSMEFLSQWATEDDRIFVGREEVGEPQKGINDRAARWAHAGNSCLALLGSVSDYTHVLWLESDLTFSLDLMSRLLMWDVDIVAPMIWIGGHFYDTWGFRDLTGRKWKNYPPYHPAYKSNSLIEMGSVGSCVLFRREIFDSGIRFRGPHETGLLVGVCNDARSKGFRVFADTTTAILHPVSLWENQMEKLVSVEVVDMENNATSYSMAELVSLGAALQVTFAGAESVVGHQQSLLRKIYRQWKTNRVDVLVEILSPLSRTYRMVLTVRPPTGLGRFYPLLALVLRIIDITRFNVKVDGERMFLQRVPLTWLIDFSGEVQLVRPDSEKGE